MSDLILHHYPSSPFSEKIRLILGYKQLAWKSVIIPQIMPKPDVVALTGGYRKTPFLQIGADIYCDSALICDVLEHRQPTPTLYPKDQKGLARIVAQWADEKLFWAAMAWNFSPKGAAQMFGGSPDAPVEQWGLKAKVFGDDRAKMRVGMPRLPAPDAAAAYRSYLRRLSDMLESQPSCWGPRPAWPTLPPTTRCGSPAPRPARWPASWTPRLRCWPGWTAWPRSGMARWKSSALPNPSHSAPVPRRPWPKKCRSWTSTALRWAPRSASPPRASAPNPRRAS
jgi:glutathione S-transferase